ADNRYYEQIGTETKDITNEIPFDIPNSWEWVRLGSVFNIILGQSPDGNSVNNKKGIEFHQGKVFFGSKYLRQSNQYTTNPSKLVQKGTVLLCVRAPVGVVNITKRNICIGRGLAGIANILGISTDFIYYWLQVYKNEFISKATGTTFIAITGDVIQNQLIPLPPLLEQNRIVQKITKMLEVISVL
ncbi:MAG: restriction endonuclease subunit S, partial [Rickettsiales bacterium]|nr:restriction endonuclease subunit S [Rickettsiales bacterium]